MLEIRGVSKAYGGTSVLRGVELAVEPGELMFHHLETFVYEPHNALAESRSVLEVFGHLAAGISCTENQDVVRPIAKAQEPAQAQVNKHPETGHQHKSKPTINENPREARAIQVALVQRFVSRELCNEFCTEQADNNQDDADDHGAEHPQNLVRTRHQEPRTVKASKGEQRKPANIQPEAHGPVLVKRLGRVELVDNPATMELHPIRQDKTNRQGGKVRKDQEHSF